MIQAGTGTGVRIIEDANGELVKQVSEYRFSPYLGGGYYYSVLDNLEIGINAGIRGNKQAYHYANIGIVYSLFKRRK